VDRILLINPNWTGIQKQKQGQFKRAWPPLDLAQAAALLEQEGFAVRVLDNNVERASPEALGALARQHDRVFVTSTPYDRWQCPALDISFFYDTIRHIPREMLYIMGAHVSERPETSLKATGARAAIIHEPELTILDICQRDLYAGQRGVATLENGRIVKGPEVEFLNEMDAMPYPAFHHLPMRRYYYEVMGRDFAILESSRGCPYRCTFCYLGMYGPAFRQKSVERFVDEVEWAVRTHGLRNIYFMDLEFALNKKFVIPFCEALIKRDLGLHWCCQTRVNDVSDEVLSLMKRAGCKLIHFGVEAGTEHVLAATNKKITKADAERAMRLMKKYEMQSILFMNLGFPGETIEDMDATIDFAIRLNPTFVSFHLIVPFPGTKLAEMVGIDEKDLPPELYPQFNDKATVDLPTLKRQLRKAYRRFYLRPGYMWHSLVGSERHFLWDKCKILYNLVGT